MGAIEGTLKYNAGLGLLLVVVVIWVASAEVTQGIFEAYDHPFALTYLGCSMFVLFIPISILSKYRKSRQKVIPLDAFIKPTLKPSLSGDLLDSDDEIDDIIHRRTSRHLDEEAMSLLSLPREGAKKSNKLLEIMNWAKKGTSKSSKSLTGGGLGEQEALEGGTKKATTREVIRAALILAPLWVLTEYLSNASLSFTSVASTTILSATSGLFTLIFGVTLGKETFTYTKLLAVVISLTGVAMTTMGTTWAADEELFVERGGNLGQVKGGSGSEHPQNDFLGDSLSIASAVTYALFTVLLNRCAGEDGEHMEMHSVFGAIGLITMCGLWWLVFPLHWIGLEPTFHPPPTMKIKEVLIANGLVGSVVSDYCWALSVVWTSPLVSTLGLSLTIPLAMVADMAIHGRHYSTIYILGSVQVFAGFVIANVQEHISKHFAT